MSCKKSQIYDFTNEILCRKVRIPPMPGMVSGWSGMLESFLLESSP